MLHDELAERAFEATKYLFGSACKSLTGIQRLLAAKLLLRYVRDLVEQLERQV